MKYEAKVTGHVDLSRQNRIVLDQSSLKDEDFIGLNLSQFCTIGCRLEKCRFDRTIIKNAQFGSGRIRSEFVECSFDGARMKMGPGGFARFVRCSFNESHISDWTCFAVEFVDCVFSGSLTDVIFNGTVPEEKRIIAGRVQNEFSGNDFSDLKFRNVSFRTGVDLSKQRLPAGSKYLYLPEAKISTSSARSALNALPDDEIKRAAIALLKVFEENVFGGQQQLFLREDDYLKQQGIPAQAVTLLFSILRETRTGSQLEL